MNEPKVSEEMWMLVENTIACAEGAMEGPPNDGAQAAAAREELLSAIAALEARAEKAETVEFMAGVLREHYADVVFPDADDEPKASDSDWIVCAINELGTQIKRAEKAEAECDKWKRVAVAIEICGRARAEYNRAQIRAELLGAYEDVWTKADLEFAEAITALGPAWPEALAVTGEE